MNLKERIQDIFESYSVLLEVEEKEEVKEEVQMAEKTLANGTVIYTDADDFIVGAEVFIVNEEGERMPLPDGEYEYEGGGKTLISNGAIAEMVEAEEEVEEEEEVEVEVEMEEKVEEKEEEEEEVEETFTKEEVEEMVKKAVEEAKEKLSAKLSKNRKELEDLKQTLSTQKAEGGLRRSPSKEKRMSFADIKKLTQKERVSALYELYSNK
jgi:hypothetical protein